MHQILLRLGLYTPDGTPMGELTALPQTTQLDLWGLLRGERGKMRGKGEEMKEKGGRGARRERRGKGNGRQEEGSGKMKEWREGDGEGR